MIVIKNLRIKQKRKRIVLYCAVFFLCFFAVIAVRDRYVQNNTNYSHGQEKVFNLDNKKFRNKSIHARLQAPGSVLNIWVDSSTGGVSKQNIAYLNDEFSTKIYPTNLNYLADGNTGEKVTKINILITELGKTDGYFSARDLGSGHHSNLLLLDIGTVKNESSEARATMAHEFAHLLYYLNGAPQNESLDEGLAVYAEYINGHYPNYALADLRSDRTKEIKTKRPSYGATFLAIIKATEKIERSGKSVPAYTRSLADGSNSWYDSASAMLKKYFSYLKLTLPS